MNHNKIYLSMAALVLVCAMTAGCSSDDNLAKIEITQPEIDNGNQTAVYTITVNLDEAGGTRALNPTTGVKTFSEDDQIALIYKDNTTGQLAKLVSNALTTADISNEGKSATFSFNSTPIPVADSKVRYIYPASMATATMPTGVDADNDGTVDYSALANQNGTAASLANVDLGIYDGTASGTVLPTSFTLVNPLTIGAFTVKNSATGDDISSTVTNLTIDDGTNTYTVNRTAAEGPIYVAMKPITSIQTVTVKAITDNNKYIKSVTGNTLAKNTMYPINVSMTARYPLAANDTSLSTEDIGKVLAADGKIYADAASANTNGGGACAVIAYVGSVPNYFDKFLAIALTDVDNNTHTWADAHTAVGTFANSHGITIGSMTYNTNAVVNTYYDVVDDDWDRFEDPQPVYTQSATRTNAVLKGWRLPSVTDWRYIIQGFGGPSATNPIGVIYDGMYASMTFLNVINTACGNTEIQRGSYWTSSLYANDENEEWVYEFDRTNGTYHYDFFVGQTNSYSYHVCAVFAY